MIQIENLTYNYLGSKKKVFDGLSFSLSENGIYGLLGKNGMGKSTLLYLMTGLLRAKSGTVKVDGRDMSRRLPESLGEMFIVPEEYSLPHVSLKEFVSMNRDFYPRFSEEVLRRCLDDFELPPALHLKELSMGQKKKVYMSIALAAGTRFVFMDEPTNGLDIPSKSLFRKVVANSMTDDRMLIISTHQVHDVEALLDHILILDSKGLLLNSPVAGLTERYDFGVRQPAEMDSDVVYAEPSLQGNNVIARHVEGTPETQVNIELLFNAVIKGIIK